jgi:hypothetical protein
MHREMGPCFGLKSHSLIGVLLDDVRPRTEYTGSCAMHVLKSL